MIDVEPATGDREATVAVRFFDEWGRLTWLYAAGGWGGRSMNLEPSLPATE